MRAPAERAMTNEARMTLARLRRHEAAIKAHGEEADDAFKELDRLWLAAEVRFGIDVPRDAMLLDVLALIDVEGDRWMWKGPRSHNGTPVVRLPRTERVDGGKVTAERTTARWLAIKFGLMSENETGMLFCGPTVDQADVNPWKRYLHGQRLGT